MHFSASLDVVGYKRIEEILFRYEIFDITIINRGSVIVNLDSQISIFFKGLKLLNSDNGGQQLIMLVKALAGN